ncbi:RNA-directed DNA polymerase [Erwinia tasmaniensis]|nr:RNA-directed DNA polymerase [Erwinia tasmaniensis]
MNTEAITILELTHEQAQDFFLKSESYFNADMPPYFNFRPILDAVKNTMGDLQLNGIMAEKKVIDCEKVNHTIHTNKDGKLSWRPLQLIHPVLYFYLVRELTEAKNWEKIKERFSKFSSNQKITCLSIPVKSSENKKDKAAQVNSWWQKFELQSIELAIDYDYLFETDIADCYGSIYTHSIAWAVETKEVAKINRSIALLGNFIDKTIQKMQFNQTNGIPQGSVLMDFIAEITLGYIDEIVGEKLSEILISDYKILRYRDDYRIFVNNQSDGELILKTLADVMSDMGFRLNSSKTKSSSDIITSSVKSDKNSWMASKGYHNNLLKHCSLIKQHSLNYPNSGSLSTALSEFHKRIVKLKKFDSTTSYSIISIIIDISYRNPRTYPVAFAILSKYLSLITDIEERTSLIKRINIKFNKLPNIGYMEIWFQRAIKSNIETITFNEKLCNLVTEPNNSVWNSEWISSKKIMRIMNTTPIIDLTKLHEIEDVIDSLEFDLFPRISG